VIRIMNLQHQRNGTFLPHFKTQSTQRTCSNYTNFKAYVNLMTLYQYGCSRILPAKILKYLCETYWNSKLYVAVLLLRAG